MSGDKPGTDERFRRLHPLSPLLRSGIFFAAWAGWVLNNARNGITAAEVLVSGVVAAVAGLVIGAAAWWFTRFRVSAEEIRVESGVLRRQSRQVRIERLQAVEVQQPLLARVFGLAELSLEVAGAESGARLAFLPLGQAVELRRRLLERSVAAAAAGPAATERVLFSVGTSRLLASQFLRTGFVTAAVSALTGLAASVAGGAALGLVLVLGAVLGVASVVFRSFAAFYGFTLRESAQGLRISSGLLGLRSQTVPVGRVQGVVLVEPVLWRALRWVRVDVTVAGTRGAGQEGEQVASTLLPVADRAEALALVSFVLGADPTAVSLHEPPRRAAWIAPITRRTLGVGMDSALVVTTRGLLTTRTDVVPRTKIQSVRLIRGPLQRALGLASVAIDIPRGPVAAVAAHRADTQAWQLALMLAAAFDPALPHIGRQADNTLSGSTPGSTLLDAPPGGR